jgi:hypothetical protein
MKKVKLMTIALAAAVMMLGAGYAYWTSQVSVTTNASTGNLKVEFVQQGGACPLEVKYPDKDVWDERSPICLAKAQIDTTNASLTTLTIDNMYPGVTAWYHVKIANTGTIPAKVGTIDVTPTNPNQLAYKKLYVSGAFAVYNKNNVLLPKNIAPYSCKLTDFPNVAKNCLKDIILNPGDYIVFDIPSDGTTRQQLKDAMAANELNLPDDANCMFISLPFEKNVKEYLDSDNTKSSMNNNVSFNMVVNFKQFNQQ